MEIKNRLIDFSREKVPAEFSRLVRHIVRVDPAQLGSQLLARLDALQLRQLSPCLHALADTLLCSRPLLSASLLEANHPLYVAGDGKIAIWNFDADQEPYLLATPGPHFAWRNIGPTGNLPFV